MGRAFVSDAPTHHPIRCRLLGSAPHGLDPCRLGRGGSHPLEPKTTEKSLLSASHLDQRGIGETQCHRTLLWPRLPLLSSATSTVVWLVNHRSACGLDLHPHHHCRSAGPSRRPP